ncbi:MAG: M81 family metallopeptidase [Crenarchaeota archaeon]|nr:M81 family metallopeptidase [Thermoproteota archaeon]
MVRIVIGSFGAESNSFSVESPVNQLVEVLEGQDLLIHSLSRRTAVGGFLEVLQKNNVEIVPTIKAYWGTTGIIGKESFEYYKSELCNKIRQAGKIDGVLLDLHGAMVAEDAPDAEGILLKDIRNIVGNEKPIVCVLDLHGNITDLKLQSATAILGYRSNPHIDLFDRGKKAARLILNILKGKVRPVMRVRRLQMLGPNLGMSTWSYRLGETRRLPFAKIMEKVSKLEKTKGILDLSVFIGFPYSDIQECLTTVVAIADGEPELAQKVADKIGDMVWGSRNEFLKIRPLIPVEKAIEIAVAAKEGPIVLVDVGDNSGGGAPCDNTVILKELLKRSAKDAVVPLRDPEAVGIAFAAGVGKEIELEVGGKIDKRFYKPVKVKAKVKTLFDGKYVIRGPYHGGFKVKGNVLPREAWKVVDVGKTALLEVDGIEIIVSEGRVGMEQDYYKAVGIDPSQRKIVVVKSHQAHRASFERIAKRIIEVDTPGVTSPSYKGLTFKNIPRPTFPLDPI